MCILNVLGRVLDLVQKGILCSLCMEGKVNVRMRKHTRAHHQTCISTMLGKVRSTCSATCISPNVGSNGSEQIVSCALANTAEFLRVNTFTVRCTFDVPLRTCCTVDESNW